MEVFKKIEGEIRDVQLIEQQLFIGTSKGLWIFDKNNKPIEVKKLKDPFLSFDLKELLVTSI